jgi:ABC-type glycerol-3-phosphate transport system substrate-binding protein
MQAGVALGAGDNIDRASDIISLLMVQNGTQVIEEGKNRANFSAAVPGKTYNPGVSAIKFYSNFANPALDVYSWNATMPNSLQAFANGRLAIMFGYAYNVANINVAAPKLNYGILPMPQIQGTTQPKNVADYWVETVSKKSKNKAAAWDFIQFMTTSAKNNNLYLRLSGRLPALRSQIDEAKKNDQLAVFANQLLTANTWYRGYNYKAADQAFKDMMSKVNLDAASIEGEASIAASKISNTLLSPKND